MAAVTGNKPIVMLDYLTGAGTWGGGWGWESDVGR